MSKVFLFRHGKAVQVFNNDEIRELTPKGYIQVQEQSIELEKVCNNFDLVLVSPYLRAQQTLTALMETITCSNIIVTNEITPDAYPEDAYDLIKIYAKEYDAHNILVVAHMPILGDLYSLITKSYPINFKLAQWEEVSL